MFDRKRLKFIFVLCLSFLLSNSVVTAQGKAIPAAWMDDEFGDENPSRTIARLDGFASSIRSSPKATAFVISYRSRLELPGKSVRILNAVKRYLMKTWQIDSQRLALVDGGVARCTGTELWIVAPGTTPKPRTDAYPQVIEDVESVRKYDEFFFPLDESDYEGSYGFANTASLETFAVVVKNERTATAYVIAYPQYYTDKYEDEDGGKKIIRRTVYRDEANAAARMLREVKNKLTKSYNLNIGKIKLVNGGYRKQRAVELWIVPRGEHAPVATPNAFPQRRRSK